MSGRGRSIVLIVAAATAAVAPTAASANPLAAIAVGHVLGKIFGHHSTNSTAQAQGLSPQAIGDNVVSSKVEKMELERIRGEIRADRKAKKWKPLKEVRFLPPGTSNR